MPAHLPETMLPLAQYLDDRLNRDGQKLSVREARLLGRNIKDMDSLEKTLPACAGADAFENIDDSLLEQAMGSEALQKWQAIKNLPETLSSGAFIKKPQPARFTPAGLQKTAWNMLKETVKPARNEKLSAQALGRPQYRALSHRGHTALSVRRPAAARYRRIAHEHAEAHGRPAPAAHAEEDLEVYEKEPILRTATAILIDLSKSMKYQDRYRAAKKVAMALIGLIRPRYVQDRIAVVGFSTSARLIPEHEIPFLPFDDKNPGTNFEEAFAIGQHALARMKGYRRQIFLITDGEPTAHREAGSCSSSFRPTPKPCAAPWRP